MKKIRGFLWNPMEKRGARCRRFLQLRRSLNNILSARAVRYVSDREADKLFDLVYIVLSLSRKSIKFTDAGDVAFPSRQFLQDRLCFFQSDCGREASSDLAVDLVAHAYRDLVQIAERIQHGESNFRRALCHAAVLSSNSIEPADSSRSASCRAVFAAVTAAFTQFFCFFFVQDLADERTAADCTGVSLYNGDDIFEDVYKRQRKS